jgi:hypothetical protein
MTGRVGYVGQHRLGLSQIRTVRFFDSGDGADRKTVAAFVLLPNRVG